MKQRIYMFIPVFMAVMITGCQNVAGMGSTPDEFRIVKKSPLIIPPDYNLLPPEPGKVRPGALDDSADLAFTVDTGENASLSEQALVAIADARAVSAVIREQIDYEQAGIIRKDKGTSDRIIAWDGQNAEDSAEDNATGGKPVTIEAARKGRKLPGT